MDSGVSTHVIREAVRETGARMNALGNEPASPFLERDLGKIFTEALHAALRTEALDLTVKTEHPVTFVEWPGVGGVDIAVLDAPHSAVAFIELKWGAGTLYNCVWDLPKMALAVARKHTASGFLVAGAPASEWANAEGAELFETQEWLVSDLLLNYRKIWDAWGKDVKTHPVSLPQRLQTELIATVPVTFQGAAWELRCVETFASDTEWIDVSSVQPPEFAITLERWKEHFSWGPGDIEILTPAEAAEILGGRPESSEPSGDA